MGLELKGVITQIGNKNYYGNDGKYNCEFVIETQEQYPKKVCFEAHNEKCDKILELSVGQEINVHFNLSSREYQGRYYTKATMWKFDAEKAGEPVQYANHAQSQKPVSQVPSSAELPEEEKLPF